MSEKEYKIKCENLFAKNTILLNQQKIDAEQILSLQKQNGELTDKVKELEAQIEKMKCDVLSLIKDRMNDDIDQNIIERLAEKWEIKEK